MRISTLAFAGILSLAGSVALAQTTPNPTVTDIHKDNVDIRKDSRDIKADKKDRKDLKKDKKDRRHDIKDRNRDAAKL